MMEMMEGILAIIVMIIFAERLAPPRSLRSEDVLSGWGKQR